MILVRRRRAGVLIGLPQVMPCQHNPDPLSTGAKGASLQCIYARRGRLREPRDEAIATGCYQE